MNPNAVRNFSGIGFGSGVLLMLVIGVFATYSLRTLIESNKMVGQTLIVLSNLEETIALIADVEAGQRGYIITGEEEFLEPYNAALSASDGIGSHLQELRQLTRDNPAHQQRLDMLDSLVAEKLAFAKETVDLRRNVGFDAAQQAVLTGEGKRTMDEIRQIITRMQNEESENLEARTSSASVNLQNTLVVWTTGAGLSLLLLLLSFYVVNRQVRERQRAEKALQQLNDELDQRVEQRTTELATASERFISTLDNILEGCQIIGYDWRYLYVNEAVARQGRRTRDELLGHTMMEMYPGIEHTDLFVHLRQCMEERVPFHWDNEFTYPDGLTGWFELSLQPVPEGIFILSLDITERKRAEEILRQREIEFRSLAENIPDIVARFDPDLRHIYINGVIEKITGIPAESFIGKTNRDLPLPEGQTALWDENLQGVFEQGEARTIEFEFPSVAGLRYFESQLVPEIGETGDVERVLSIARDITDRKRAADQLKYHARLLRHINDAVVATDDQFRVNAWNRAAEKMYGWSTEEVIGHNISEILSFELSQEQRAEARELLKESIDSRSERIVRRRDGKTLYVEASTIVLTDERGKMTGYVSVNHDITERKRAESKTLLQLQRLKALRAIDIAISSSFDLRVTLDILLDQVTSHLNADAAAILLFGPVSQTLNYGAGRGFRSTAIRQARVSVNEAYAGKAIIEGRMLHNSNLLARESDLPRDFLLMLREEAFVEYYCVPLVVKGETKGVLEIFHRSALNADREWVDFLETLAGQAAIAIDNATLFEDLQHSHRELFKAYDATIEGWSRALDLRDKETEGHTRRVTEMTLVLARRIDFTEDQLIHIRWGALLHDMGKLGVPDHILLKPDKLTEQEWEIMKKHPIFAFEMLSPIFYLKSSLDIPYCHHEKWDGTGYPRGLKAEAIPLAARLFAVVDVWDALCSDRPYRKAWSKEKALEYIDSLSGTHFDPKVVGYFRDIMH